MALEKSKPSVLGESLGWITLWRDDLKKIVDAMMEIANPGESLLIQVDDNYTASNVDDLVDHPEHRVNQITILIGAGRVRLHLAPAEALIEVVEPDTLAKGMISNVQDIASGCSSMAPLFQQSARVAAKIRPSVFGLFGSNGIISLFRLDAVARSGAILFTRTRVDAPTFWMRKRDDLWLALISALVGGVIGYFVNMIS